MQFPSILTLQKNWQRILETNTLKNNNKKTEQLTEKKRQGSDKEKPRPRRAFPTKEDVTEVPSCQVREGKALSCRTRIMPPHLGR